MSTTGTDSANDGDDGYDWRQDHETNNLFRRALAAIIDLVVLGILFGIFSYAFGDALHYRVITTGSEPTTTILTFRALVGSGLAAYVCACFLYFIVLERVLGWTIGKVLFSLRVVTLTEGRLSTKQALIRNGMRIIDGIPYVIPYVMAMSSVVSNPNRQRWGDRLAHTIVIDSV